MKAKIDYSKNSPVLQMLRLGYSRSGDRWVSLNFRCAANRVQTLAAWRIIGRHYEFDCRKMAKFIRALPIGTRFEVGREQSPVLYITTAVWRQGNQEQVIRDALEIAGVHPSEFDVIGIWTRLWWD